MGLSKEREVLRWADPLWRPSYLNGNPPRCRTYIATCEPDPFEGALSDDREPSRECLLGPDSALS